jgi:hypothetical protein
MGGGKIRKRVEKAAIVRNSGRCLSYCQAEGERAGGEFI